MEREDLQHEGNDNAQGSPINQDFVKWELENTQDLQDLDEDIGDGGGERCQSRPVADLTYHLAHAVMTFVYLA